MSKIESVADKMGRTGIVAVFILALIELMKVLPPGPV